MLRNLGQFPSRGIKFEKLKTENPNAIVLPALDVLVVIDKPIYLMEGDVLEGGSDGATADIFISYEVIDDA